MGECPSFGSKVEIELGFEEEVTIVWEPPGVADRDTGDSMRSQAYISFGSYDALEVRVLACMRVERYCKVLTTADDYSLRFVIELHLLGGKNIRPDEHIGL